MECVIPDVNCCDDAQSDGWVSFYNYPFEIGMTFPFSNLVTDFLRILDVSPSQLMPTTWRILSCLDSIEAKYQLGIDVSVVSYSYQAKKFSGGLYGLVGHKKRDHLILNLSLFMIVARRTNFSLSRKLLWVVMALTFVIGGTLEVISLIFSRFCYVFCIDIRCVFHVLSFVK